MDSLQIWHLSFMLAWMFVFFFPSVCSGVETPQMHLDTRVFVAFTGGHLDIECTLKMPVNESGGILTCSDPSDKQFYNCVIPATEGQPRNFKQMLQLKDLRHSGEYSCGYKGAKVCWYLRLSDGYKDLSMLDYTEFIIVAVFTGVLLVFSVVGSVCVFRGHWKERTTENGNTDAKRKQTREERQEKEKEGDIMDVITSQSTSFYASLEPRPRSIYDVLDHSAANREPSHSKAKKKEPKKKMVQTTKPQNEDVFESVYENF